MTTDQLNTIIQSVNSYSNNNNDNWWVEHYHPKCQQLQ